jgi:hypothetical protein
MDLLQLRSTSVKLSHFSKMITLPTFASREEFILKLGVLFGELSLLKLDHVDRARIRRVYGHLQCYSQE